MTPRNPQPKAVSQQSPRLKAAGCTATNSGTHAGENVPIAGDTGTHSAAQRNAIPEANVRKTVANGDDSQSQQTMWRCRRCGKWSHAKRRPTSHQAVKVLEETPRTYRKSVMVHCGPFDRFVAEREDSTPPPDNPDFFGRHVFGTEQEWSAADPDEGIVPW